MNNKGLTERMAEYVRKRNELLEKESELIVCPFTKEEMKNFAEWINKNKYVQDINTGKWEVATAKWENELPQLTTEELIELYFKER